MIHCDNEKNLKITQIKVIYIHLRDNNLYPKCKCLICSHVSIVQYKLLKKLIDKVLMKLKENEISEMAESDFPDYEGSANFQKEGFFELLAAHKDLIEVSENQQEKFILINQAFKFIEKANYEVNLDFIKWLISYSWNFGI